ncbi:MAG: hypothetical protein WC289_01730 [Patescibacteria group bacterium]|jgi:hypothetical protein
MADNKKTGEVGAGNDSPAADDTRTQKQSSDAKSKKSSSNSDDNVSGFWEGIGQFIRELPKDRSTTELIVLWIVGLASAKIVVSSLKDAMNSDPNLKKLDAIHRQQLIEQVSEHLDHFFDRGKNGVLAVKKEVYEKAAQLKVWLSVKDELFARNLRPLIPQVNQNTVYQRAERTRYGFGPLACFGRKLNCRRKWYVLPVFSIGRR